MIARISIYAAAALLGLAVEAGAREYQSDASPRQVQAPDAEEAIQLAQAREVEVFFDRYGREVLVDVYTGEVVGVREPRSSIRRFGFEPPRERRQDRYYLDDPEDLARLRREKRLEALGRDGYPPVREFPEYRDYRALPDPVSPEDEFARESPRYGDPLYEDDPAYGDRGFEQALPRAPERDRVVRAPLDGSSVAVIPDASAPETTIEGSPGGALPDITTAPEIGQGDASEDVTKFQVLLDRVGASPGVIDGRIGDNVNKAIAAYRDLTGKTLRTYDKEFVEAELAATGGDAFTTYEIAAVDVAGPFVASVPPDYGEKAKLERLGFVSVAEMLAERFHMDEKYLRAINPGVNFDRPGTIVNVVNIGKPLKGTVTRVVADKGKKQVRAYGDDGKLIAVYPSTIGSQATPSPTGTHTVQRVAFDPVYTYNPKLNFKQGNNDKVLTIPPGPNGPVGTIWIALSKPTYGIHGTPDPSKIGKTESNGCIRLTNWDAQELAKMVQPGTTVEFVE